MVYDNNSPQLDEEEENIYSLLAIMMVEYLDFLVLQHPQLVSIKDRIQQTSVFYATSLSRDREYDRIVFIFSIFELLLFYGFEIEI